MNRFAVIAINAILVLVIAGLIAAMWMPSIYSRYHATPPTAGKSGSKGNDP